MLWNLLECSFAPFCLAPFIPFQYIDVWHIGNYESKGCHYNFKLNLFFFILRKGSVKACLLSPSSYHRLIHTVPISLGRRRHDFSHRCRVSILPSKPHCPLLLYLFVGIILNSWLVIQECQKIENWVKLLSCYFLCSEFFSIFLCHSISNLYLKKKSEQIKESKL
jgi:hypothetical protein